MAWIGSAVGTALSSIATIGANLDADKTRGQLLTLGTQDPKYSQSIYAGKKMALATNLINARMPGAAAQEQNIYGAQAGQDAAIDRTATDAGQALAAKAAAAGTTDKAFANLGQQEAQFNTGATANYNQAADSMTNEADKQYQDNVRQWQDKINILLARSGIKQNEWQNVNNLGSSMSSMNFGSMGGK